jgi:putative toxin-antitoxin system antitoxin component (TIGR02293 family)
MGHRPLAVVWRVATYELPPKAIWCNVPSNPPPAEQGPPDLRNEQLRDLLRRRWARFVRQVESLDAQGPSNVRVAEPSPEYRAADPLAGLDDPELRADLVRAGLPASAVQALGDRLGLSRTRMLQCLRIPPSNFLRRERAGTLTPDESDAVARVVFLLGRATEWLGDQEAAAAWLRTPAPAFDAETPLERAGTGAGGQDVDALIGRLEHGIPA